MATQELVAADVVSTVHRYIDAFNEGERTPSHRKKR
jgi:hypothetical protein